MVCKVCGARNQAGAEYCASCGAPLKSTGQKSGIRHPYLILTILAVVAGCIYGVGLSLYLL